MKRRKALIGSAVLAGISANKVFAVDAKGSNKRFGDIVIPPEQELGKKKHVPIIDAPSSVKAGEPFMVPFRLGKSWPIRIRLNTISRGSTCSE